MLEGLGLLGLKFRGWCLGRPKKVVASRKAWAKSHQPSPLTLSVEHTNVGNAKRHKTYLGLKL